MARKKKEKGKDQEELADEEIKSDEPVEDEAVQDSEETDEKEDQGPKAKARKPRRGLIGRWWIPGLAILILAAAGTALFLNPDLPGLIRGKRTVDYSIDLTNDNLQEEGLSPT